MPGEGVTAASRRSDLHGNAARWRRAGPRATQMRRNTRRLALRIQAEIAKPEKQTEAGGKNLKITYFFFPSFLEISSTIFGRRSARTLSTMLATESESDGETSSGWLSAPTATAFAAVS